MALTGKYTLTLNYTNDLLKYSKNKPSFLKDEDFLKTKEFEVQETYVAIEKLEGNKDKLEITVCVYENETKKDKVETLIFDFKPNVSEENTPNFYTQGYDFLKENTTFKGFLDC